MLQVLSKFNREGSGFVDFLDFVTYVPLFIEIHKRIIQDPFNDSLDIWATMWNAVTPAIDCRKFTLG